MTDIRLVRTWTDDVDGGYYKNSIYLIEKDTYPYNAILNIVTKKPVAVDMDTVRSALNRCTYLAILTSTTVSTHNRVNTVSHHDRMYIVNEEMENIAVFDIGMKRHDEIIFELLKHPIEDWRDEFRERYMK